MTGADAPWMAFVAAAPRGTLVSDLAAVVGQPVGRVRDLRRVTGAPPAAVRCDFAVLFAQWHGRPPAESEWPVPRRSQRGYDWQAPELALLASLVGTTSLSGIADVLTKRLKALTGDPDAVRSGTSVQIAINRCGLQTTDVVSGLTVPQAGKVFGTEEPIRDAIRRGDLEAKRVGRLLLIPHASWAAWLATRRKAPEGYVRLATLKEPLAIKSDKLPEFARMGYVPGAILCDAPIGQASSVRGVWYIPQEVADQMLADRRAGRRMPWQGMPLMDNLKSTWKKWQPRMHPATCETCSAIWGHAGAPTTFDDFVARYPPLELGAKRHLTRPWSPGLTAKEVAKQAGRSLGNVSRAISTGQLKSRVENGHHYVAQADATLWIARGCPSGDRANDWCALATATQRYGFTEKELREFIAANRLQTRIEPVGPNRGTLQVAWRQVAKLREDIGFTEEQAAAKVGVSIADLRILLEGVQWRRQGEGIPLFTVQALVKRRQSKHGHTIAEAAAILGESVAWVEARIVEGVARLYKPRWTDRTHITDIGLEALRRAAITGPAEPKPPAGGLTAPQAALLAGVCKTTIVRWASEGLLVSGQTRRGPVYDPESVKRQARIYWASARFHRDTRPDWLKAEIPHYQPRRSRAARLVEARTPA
ncbi:MAG: helix-turn-helix domain-containing protein [Mesorhizobium sp.]|nr:helix-turn-helix domain-containing protein [Mesorhizobium sp.]